MESSSSEKTMEKQPPPPAQMNKGKDLHVSLPTELVESMRNNENWRERFPWTYDEEKVRRVWEIQQKMDVNDLFRYVMWGDGEEVVWDYDVWNLQGITQIPEQPPQPQEPKTAKDGEEPPSPTSTEKPNKDSD